MSGVNKVILIGRLGKDPDIRVMPNGDTLANISIATSETWKDKNTGEKKEKTQWHNVVIFGKLADIASQYLKKGSNVYIEGKLHTEKYEKNGQDVYTTKVYVQSFGGVMQMLDSKQEQQQQTRPAAQMPSQQLAQKRQEVNGEIFDDDVPF